MSLSLVVSVAALLISAASYRLAHKASSRGRAKDIELTRRRAMLLATTLTQRATRMREFLDKLIDRHKGTPLETRLQSVREKNEQSISMLLEIKKDLGEIESHRVADPESMKLETVVSKMEVLSLEQESAELTAKSLAESNGA